MPGSPVPSGQPPSISSSLESGPSPCCSMTRSKQQAVVKAGPGQGDEVANVVRGDVRAAARS